MIGIEVFAGVVAWHGVTRSPAAVFCVLWLSVYIEQMAWHGSPAVCQVAGGTGVAWHNPDYIDANYGPLLNA